MIEYRFNRLFLFVTGVAVAVAIGFAVLVLDDGSGSQIQSETTVETVSIGKIRFVSEPGEPLGEAEVIENRVVRVTDTSATSDNVTETITRNVISGWLPTQFQKVEIKFRLDRESRTYEHDLVRFMVADEIRHGYHSFPTDVNPDKTYPIWIEEFFQPLDAVYVGATQIGNISVMEFAIEVADAAVWADSHASISRRVGDARLTYFVEPRTGIIVDQSSDIIIRSLDQAIGWLLTFEQHMQFSPETVLANIARSKALLNK